MWLRDPLAIEVSRTAVTPVGFQLWDEPSNSPLDITGFTFSCNVSRIEGSARVASHPVDVTSYTNGEFEVIFDGSVYVGASMSEVDYAYEVKATDGSGQSVIAMRGPLIVVPGIN